jgi:hypothetical protein
LFSFVHPSYQRPVPFSFSFPFTSISGRLLHQERREHDSLTATRRAHSVGILFYNVAFPFSACWTSGSLSLG